MAGRPYSKRGESGERAGSENSSRGRGRELGKGRRSPFSEKLPFVSEKKRERPAKRGGY